MFAMVSEHKSCVAGVFSALRAVLIASSTLMAGACAQNPFSLSALTDPHASSGITTSSTPGAKPSAAAPPTDVTQAELRKATQYWGNLYAKDPSDGEASYNYARNLKALGEKQQALAVLQSSVDMNPQHRGILSEYGRLAIEFDQISVAQRMLERADDPLQPDWRVISARGTVMAKQGLYADSIPFYERAMSLAPDRASVLNNLALAYTMEGQLDKAEPLLRKAAALGKDDARVARNLELVASLRGNSKVADKSWTANTKTASVAGKADAKAGKSANVAWKTDVYAKQ